jgi:predicted nuclease of predicted toxin-antitoxin system
MKLLVDMNLSPEWVAVLKEAGWEAEHWSKVGDPRAADSEIMAWATTHGQVVFTHDLDFGSLLALTQAEKPSVIQVRTQDVTPAAIGKLVVNALRQFQPELEKGALIVLDESRARARILPLRTER